jgi:hypothetical protein
MHERYFILIALLFLAIGFILFIIGVTSIPARPPTTRIGDTQISGISDSEYNSMVVHSPAFIEFMTGIGLAVIAALLFIFRIKEEPVVPERAVAPILKKEVRFADSA